MGRMIFLAILGLAWSAGAVEPARPPAAPGAQLLRAGNATHPPASPVAKPLRAGSVAGGPAKPAKAAEDTNSTVITSTQLSFDQQKRKAVFDGNVVVTDREIKILSDRLEVFFTADNKVGRIEAEGRVTIIRNDLKATAEKATYDIKEGKMQLTGNPRIQRDQDALTGETVTLWRNSKRILCEPNARLVIASEQEMNRSYK